MTVHLGFFNTSGTRTVVRHAFTTHDTDGAAVAPSSAFEAADIRIYKNNGFTQRASESGYTVDSPFDSVTGLHGISIDLTDNTDSGFYATGSWYMIVLVPDETVDGLAVVKVLAYFEIGPQPVNALQFNGSAAAAARLALSAAQIIPGTVDTGSFSATTTQFEADDVTEATANHYNGRVILFTSGALAGQATAISDYALSGANGHFTVVALTEAPGNNDTFIIV